MICEVAKASVADVDRAVRAAKVRCCPVVVECHLHVKNFLMPERSCLWSH